MEMVVTSANKSTFSFLQARCLSYRLSNSVRALKGTRYCRNVNKSSDTNKTVLSESPTPQLPRPRPRYKDIKS